MDRATIENIINTKGYAFLTQGQKDFYNQIQTPTAQTPTVLQTNTTPSEKLAGNLTAPTIPDNLYKVYTQSVTQGALTPQQAQQQLQSLISSGQYSGSVDTSKLFPTGLSYTQNGQTYQFDNTGTGNPIKTSTTNPITTVGASGASTTQGYDVAAAIRAASNLSPEGLKALGYNSVADLTKAITPASLGSATSYNIGSTTPSPTSTSPIIAGATVYDQQVKDAQAKEATAQSQYDTLSKQISDLLGTTVGRGADQLNQEQALNIPGLKSQLANVNAQIQTKLAEYNALSTDIQGKPITMNSIIGAQAQIKNQAAAEIGLLQAQAQGLTGQIDVAQKTADRAVDLKYQDVKDLLDVKIKQLALIKDDLTAKEKKTADLLDQQYKAQQLQLTTQIANEKDKNATLLNQMQTYPDAGITLNDTLETANQKVVNNSKIYADKIKGIGGESAVSPDTLQGMLNVYKSTGVLPSFGLSANNPLRAQFYAALGADGGLVTDANANKTIRAGLNQAYKTQQNQLAANETAINTLDQQLNLAKQYSDKVSRTDSPLVNKYLLAVQNGVFGDPDTAALHNIVTTASYELAKIISGSAASISGVTVNSAADAERLINSAMAKGQFNEVLGLMKQEAQFRLNSQKDTLQRIQDDLNNIGSLSSDLKSTNQPVIDNQNLTVTVQGQTFSFPSLDQLNGFLKEAGLQ